MAVCCGEWPLTWKFFQPLLLWTHCISGPVPTRSWGHRLGEILSLSFKSSGRWQLDCKKHGARGFLWMIYLPLAIGSDRISSKPVPKEKWTATSQSRLVLSCSDRLSKRKEFSKVFFHFLWRQLCLEKGVGVAFQVSLVLGSSPGSLGTPGLFGFWASKLFRNFAASLREWECEYVGWDYFLTSGIVAAMGTQRLSGRSHLWHFLKHTGSAGFILLTEFYLAWKDFAVTTPGRKILFCHTFLINILVLKWLWI